MGGISEKSELGPLSTKASATNAGFRDPSLSLPEPQEPAYNIEVNINLGFRGHTHAASKVRDKKGHTGIMKRDSGRVG